MGQVERRVVDRQMVKLLRSWLRAGVFEGGVVSEVEARTPQGSPVSPLLANIALHVLDEAWAETGWRLGTLVRYCDDYVVVCATRREPNRHVSWRQPLGTSRAALHPDKTKIVCSAKGQSGFDSWASTTAWWSPGNARPLLAAEVAVESGHGLYQSQGQGTDPGATTESIWAW